MQSNISLMVTDFHIKSTAPAFIDSSPVCSSAMMNTILTSGQKRQYFPASLGAGHHGHTLALFLIFFEKQQKAYIRP
jgi:hypothetical protein